MESKIELKIKCPVCGHLAFEEEDDYDICDNCFWKNDKSQADHPDRIGGANHDTSLNQYRRDWLAGKIKFSSVFSSQARKNKRRQGVRRLTQLTKRFGRRHAENQMWTIKTDTPISAKDFAAIKTAILSLKNAEDNFIIIDLLGCPRNALFIQVAIWEEGIWFVELNFDEGKIIRRYDKGKYKVKINPWTQYRFFTNNSRDVIRIFRRLLCRGKFPNLRDWVDCTESIVLDEPAAICDSNRLHLEKLTAKMFRFIKKELGHDKAYVLSCEENEDVRQQLIDELVDIEIEGVNSDGTVDARSRFAADILNLICFDQPHDDEDEE